MASAGQGAPMVPTKPISYYMGRLNLRDEGKTTRKVLEEAVKVYGERWDDMWETMKKAMGLHPGTPEQRRIGYNLRLNATIPFGLLDEMGQPQVQPMMDQATGQMPVDEKGAPMMEPVVEQRPTWQVLKDTFPNDYLKQAKDAVKVGAQVPAFLAYDAQEAERA